MKKVIMLMFIFLSTSIFAAEWYSKAERPQNSSKDTLWYTYAMAGTGWLFNQPLERATYYNVDDFGIEYPLYLHAVAAAFVDDGYEYVFKVYAKDGITILWESETSISEDSGINTVYLPTPLILADDFWVSVTPLTGGYPRQYAYGEDYPTNSYLSDGTGGWINQIENVNLEDQYMVNHYHVLLSEYFDDPPIPDVFPPSLRSISGTECFMDRDMDLSIVVQDMNPVISPMQSQYSLDGGSTWTDFNMSVSKTNYTFAGTLPTQFDGTAGLVKFYMEDSLGNATWSEDINILWSKNTPMFVEDFENETFPPEGWSLNTTGAGWIEGDISTGAYVHGGRYAATHMDDSGPQDDWLITPTISLPATNSTTFSFWQAGYYLQYMNGIHEVGVSTDGGITFTPIWVEDASYVTGTYEDGIYYYKYFSLSDYVGQDVNIGFHYTGNYGDQLYIDDIEVFYDSQGPVIVDIIGNTALDPVIGAYVNNDLDITMTVNDDTGIQSIVGHYSYDSGTTWTDLPFSASKGEETWTAVIPAENDPVTGMINFDLVDLGGISSTSSDFDFFFVGDSIPPVPIYVTGTEVFINDPMELTFLFTDESAIDTCRASYSKDGWVTQYDFEMTPSKVHEYTYTGIIPAETESVLDGKVKIRVVDAEGNSATTADITVQWRDGQTGFTEDFNNVSEWTFTGNWANVEEGEYTSPTFALTESPGGNYAADENSTATLANSMDWSTCVGADISFWCKYDIEAGFDYMYFEITPDNGISWITLKTWDGEGIDWHEEKIELHAFVGYSQVNIRFRFESDGDYEAEGMYIDDIILNIYNIYPNPPLPVFNDPPLFYEGVLGDYTNTVDALDISGVAAVEVLYSIDGVDQDNISATYVSGDTWEFTIPMQEPGAMTYFDFWAIDNDGFETSFYGYRYSMIFGIHQIYDSGIVSYYNTTENGDAKAVRVTVPNTDSTIFEAARLKSVLIRNYADVSGHISDDMTLHVWQDDGTGKPGIEVLTPIEITPEANNLEDTRAMSVIDLRSENLIVYGNFWIGFSSDNGIVYATEENAIGEGVTEFSRSYDGISNGDGTWSWLQNTGTNYHFRAVIEYPIMGIYDNYSPTTTSLEQNYPNPFNPNTTINFSVPQNNSQIKLVVYNVKGELINTLFDGVKNIGHHSVNFDASDLNSGVYYYSLEVNGVKESTKKMVLIK
ncbi:MAG: choice-of-anchor J domain-containing protein [Candidatus Delongbacteria bacterium]|jgi:hypothetical protein|nr:choice-of-anchor J domain-containing protein [Candidatus Delongbacteria bacterium]